MHLPESATQSDVARASRRLVVFAPCALAACGFVNKSPFFSTLATFNKNASPAISRQKIDAMPYASLVAWFDGNVQALMVLGDYLPDGRRTWYSAQNQAMTTWGSIVLTLIGTDVGLYSTSLVGQWSDDPRQMVGRKLMRLLSYRAPNNQVTVTAKSSFADKGLEIVKIFDSLMRLRRIRESVVANRYHHYHNDYWVEDSSGLTWRSRQNVVPTLPALNLAITKMPKGR